MLTKRSQRAAGFTLIEMVVTVSIFAILVALTVPTMQAWIANTKIRAVADAMQNGMRLAQTESLRRSRQVVFALTNSTNPLSDFNSGSLTAAGNGNSWVVTTIPAMVDGSETPAFVASGVLTAAGSTIAIQGPAEVCFNSVGRLVTNATTGLAGGACAPAGAPVNGTTPMYTYKLSLSNGHSLNVELALGGQVHLCDPSQTLSSTNPYGC